MNAGEAMKVFGWVLLIAGLLVCAYALSMDTTVSTPVGRIHNLSLSSNRNAVLIAAGVVTIVGAIFAAVASGKTGRALDSTPENVQALNRAIAANDVRAVKALLSPNLDAAQENEFGLSPLKAAEQHGRSEILAILRAHQQQSRNSPA
jgi:ankyrin repeat protein